MSILLGYESQTGNPIKMPLHHVVITGMTQLSGKTTTLEGLIYRSNLKSITFRTKRGEIGFEWAHKMPRFFDEKGLTHWKALEGLIEATIEEKVRREPGTREQIINVCRDAKSLSDIYSKVKETIPRLREGFIKGVFTRLEAYLDLVVPKIKSLSLSETLELKQGANMMDLEGLGDEIQNLILHGVIKRIYEKESNTIIILPEAWKFIPQDRGSPCKPIIEKFIREGAVIGNYLFIDSQDLRGVDKKYLRGVDNWILGRQRARIEVDDTLDAMTLPKHLLPKPEDIMTLDIGFFYACLHNDVYKIYAQPKWLPDDIAVAVATGKMKVEDVQEYKPVPMLVRATPPEFEPTKVVPLQERPPSAPTMSPLDEQRLQRLWDRASKVEERLRE